MPTAQEQLSNNVEVFADQIEAMFGNNFSALSPAEQEELVVESLRKLVSNFKGCCAYGFNLYIEKYVEYFSDETLAVLPVILEKYLPQKIHARWTATEQTDIAFAAYYALSLIYKKTKNNDALKNLCDKPYTGFRKHYPLTNEVLARYYKRIDDYDNALQYDLLAITKLDELGFVNHGPRISYASTVCRLYDRGENVTAEQFERAEAYIQAAIEYNPNYPKYYYLKGKLIFYGAQHLRETDAFLSKCGEALAYLTKARLMLDDHSGNYFDNTSKEFKAFINKVEEAKRQYHARNRSFQEFSPEELAERKNKILASAKAADCPPPNPNLKPGRKYIFVSYNHKDFKSVYCDLLQLYHHKIPFQYDKGLAYGDPWDKAVMNLVHSEDCLGVLFYISRNTLSSAAVETECKLLRTGKRKLPYLTVNLEKDTTPTDILLQYIEKEGAENCRKNGVNSSRITTFLTTFKDKDKYFPGATASSEETPVRIGDLKEAIRKHFTGIIFGE